MMGFNRPWFSRAAIVVASSKIAGPLVLIMLVATGLLGYRQSRLNEVPDIGNPFDVEAAGSIEIDPADNASSDYEAVASLLVRSTKPEDEDIDSVLNGSWEHRTPEVERWLRDNQPALSRWLAGTKRAICLRVQPKDLTMESHSISAGDLIAIGRLCGLKAVESESIRDLDSAWDWHRALFRYSRHVGMYSTAIDRTMGAAAHGTAVGRMVRWAGDDRLTSSQLAQALSEVRGDYRMTQQRSVMIKAEYFVRLDQLNRIDEVAEAYQMVNDAFGVTGSTFPDAFELYLNNEPELTQRLLRHQVANALTFIDEPDGHRPATLSCQAAYYAKSPSDSDRFVEPARFQAGVDRSPLAHLLLMKLGDDHGSTMRESSRQRLLETVLAAELFRRKHGMFPEAVNDLVAENLMSSVPADPTSPSLDPVRYERHSLNTRRAKVWTVGQNGVDDGGVFEVIDGYGKADMGYIIGQED